VNVVRKRLLPAVVVVAKYRKKKADHLYGAIAPTAPESPNLSRSSSELRLTWMVKKIKSM
jgi:hypothetical protein